MEQKTRNKLYVNKPEIKEVKAEKYSHEWEMDTKGFFLIDPRPEEGLIYAHHYNKDKSYNVTITGKNSEEIYYTILREKLVENIMHAAYLGSELQKAEILVRYNIDWYIQDKPLILPAGLVIKGNNDVCEIKKNESNN